MSTNEQIGVLNQDARPYNLKARSVDSIIVVRLKPGLNLVDKSQWAAVSKCDLCEYLQDEGKVIVAASVRDSDAKDKDKEAQSKEVPLSGDKPVSKRKKAPAKKKTSEG